MASNSLDKIINKKIEKLNLLKNKLKIEDLEHKIDKFDKYLDFKKKIYSNFSKGKDKKAKKRYERALKFLIKSNEEKPNQAK